MIDVAHRGTSSEQSVPPLDHNVHPNHMAQPGQLSGVSPEGAHPFITPSEATSHYNPNAGFPPLQFKVTAKLTLHPVTNTVIITIITINASPMERVKTGGTTGISLSA